MTTTPIKRTLIGLAAAAALLTAPAAQAQDKLLLKTPIAFSTALPGLGSPIPRVAEQLDLMSGGTLKMKVYEPGAPAAPLFSAVPFGPEAGEYMAWLYYGNGLTLYQEMYDQAGYNVHVLPCAIIAPETAGWFAKEINTPEDLSGLKMRFFGLGGKVMQKLGVATSLLPGGEIFPRWRRVPLTPPNSRCPPSTRGLAFTSW
jgi:TRAP-type mannitol/chloroaromatic compound transport system substrate-binding protein